MVWMSPNMEMDTRGGGIGKMFSKAFAGEGMFQNVYTNPVAKGEETKAKELLERLFVYYLKHIDLLPGYYLQMLEDGEENDRVVCDYIAGMTDQYALAKYSEYFMPKSWQVY